MSEPNFTPPPWRVQESIPGRATILKDTSPAHALIVAACVTIGEAAANNARLIAVAPELYAQLEDARVTLEEAAKLMVSHYPSVANNLVNQCAIRCGDVLAKARGET